MITPYVSRAITSYSTPRGIRYVFPTRRKINAANVIRGAYYASRLAKNLKLRSAARKIQRAWKNSKAARRTLPGTRSTTRQHGEPPVNAEQVPVRALVQKEFDWPPPGDDYGDRLGATIKLSGIRICEQFTNPNSYPIVIHYAVIQPKESNINLKQDFFRDTTSGVDRSKNFTDASNVSPYEFSYDCYPINPDKYNILMHMKRMLASDNTEVNQRWSTWKFIKWLNFKGKRFTFDLSTDSQPRNPIYRVYWWQPMNAADWDVSEPLATIPRQADSVMYFRPNFT